MTTIKLLGNLLHFSDDHIFAPYANVSTVGTIRTFISTCTESFCFFAPKITFLRSIKPWRTSYSKVIAAEDRYIKKMEEIMREALDGITKQQHEEILSDYSSRIRAFEQRKTFVWKKQQIIVKEMKALETKLGFKGQSNNTSDHTMIET